jgi:D-arabinose 1-dehydrogenase-like Zn-dependent alcohol dehydrogenase
VEKMRAFQVPAAGKPFELVRHEIPKVTGDQVRVRVQACGICRSDTYAVSGIPGSLYPLIPGHEIAGVIDAVGPAVRNRAPGERVGVGWFGGQCGECASCRSGDFVTCSRLKATGLITDGGYAEYVVMPSSALARIPDGIDAVHAGPLMCAGVTAFNALRRGGAGPGRRVTVIGIGGVGHLAVMFARQMGCETIAVSRGRAKETLALKLGASHFVDALDSGAVAAIRALGGTDVVIVTSSGGDEAGRFISAVTPNGRIVVTGFSDESVHVSPVDLIARNLSVMGSAAGTAMDAEETLRFCALNGIVPVVEEFPFESAEEAYARMLTGSVNFRAVLNLDSSTDPRMSPAELGERVRATLPVDHQEDVQHGNENRPTQHAVALVGRQAGHVLDCPWEELPDAAELIKAAMRWHFSPETGSPFWLERAKQLDFEPVKDVRTVADLRLFPNVVDDLRSVSVADLIPKGYGGEPPLLGVFESGGVTGPPKRVILLSDWMERWLAWSQRCAREHHRAPGANHLIVAPTGPHLITCLSNEATRRDGGIAFTIDLDPRWVRKCIIEGRSDEADRYAEHIIAQMASVLRTQEVSILTITPPLLERLVRQPELVELVRQKISVIIWGGTHMDADTRHIYHTEIFPAVSFQGGYGSTMVLGGAFERPDLTDDDPCIFDPFSPYVTFSVVDPRSLEKVAYGDRGQVVMNHVSKAMLLPNNLERDTAIRVRGRSGQAGDSVADILPVETIGGREVTEGVY